MAVPVRSQLIDSWQRQIEINKVRSEPFVSHSPFQRHETIAIHATISMRSSQLMPQWSETIITHSKKQSETIRICLINQINWDKSSATFKMVVASVSNNVLIDLWQCQMEIESTNNFVGFCHNKKSEQVGNSASSQPQGYTFILIATCHQCHHNLGSNCHAPKIGVVTNKLINHLL